MVKKLSCVSCGSLKRFPHTFTNSRGWKGKRKLYFIDYQKNIQVSEACPWPSGHHIFTFHLVHMFFSKYVHYACA